MRQEQTVVLVVLSGGDLAVVALETGMQPQLLLY